MKQHLGLSLRSDNGEPADIHLDEDGNLAFVRDAEAVGQHARQRLKTFQGEWFLDTQAGVPWLTDILGQRYDPSLAEAVVKTEIQNTDGVTEITSFSVQFDQRTRGVAAHTITVITEYDQETTV